jgi:hypothetical protein
MQSPGVIDDSNRTREPGGGNETRVLGRGRNPEFECPGLNDALAVPSGEARYIGRNLETDPR